MAGRPKNLRIWIRIWIRNTNLLEIAEKENEIELKLNLKNGNKDT